MLTLIKNETNTNRPQAVTNRLDTAHPAWLLKDTPLLRLAGEKMRVHAALVIPCAARPPRRVVPSTQNEPAHCSTRAP